MQYPQEIHRFNGCFSSSSFNLGAPTCRLRRSRGFSYTSPGLPGEVSASSRTEGGFFVRPLPAPRGEGAAQQTEGCLILYLESISIREEEYTKTPLRLTLFDPSPRGAGRDKTEGSLRDAVHATSPGIPREAIEIRLVRRVPRIKTPRIVSDPGRECQLFVVTSTGLNPEGKEPAEAAGWPAREYLSMPAPESGCGSTLRFQQQSRCHG